MSKKGVNPFAKGSAVREGAKAGIIAGAKDNAKEAAGKEFVKSAAKGKAKALKAFGAKRKG